MEHIVSMMSRLAKRSDDSENNVYLVKGRTDGVRCWHKVMVYPHKKEEFMKQAEFGFMDVADYGKVVESGYGEYQE